jgi:hypothetical protein
MMFSRFVSTAAFVLLFLAVPGMALGQTTSPQWEAAIRAQARIILLPVVRMKLIQVGQHLREAKLCNNTRPSPEMKYLQAQREVAQGDYREATTILDDIEQRLGNVGD